MPAPAVERKLTTILAADVAEYSRLMRADEDRTLADLTAARTLVDGLIARHRGRIANTEPNPAASACPPRFASMSAHGSPRSLPISAPKRSRTSPNRCMSSVSHRGLLRMRFYLNAIRDLSSS